MNAFYANAACPLLPCRVSLTVESGDEYEAYAPCDNFRSPVASGRRRGATTPAAVPYSSTSPSPAATANELSASSISYYLSPSQSPSLSATWVDSLSQLAAVAIT